MFKFYRQRRRQRIGKEEEAVVVSGGGSVAIKETPWAIVEKERSAWEPYLVKKNRKLKSYQHWDTKLLL